MNEMRKLLNLCESDLTIDDADNLSKELGAWVPRDLRGTLYKVGDVIAFPTGTLDMHYIELRTVIKMANNTIYVAAAGKTRGYKLSYPERSVILDR